MIIKDNFTYLNLGLSSLCNHTLVIIQQYESSKQQLLLQNLLLTSSDKFYNFPTKIKVQITWQLLEGDTYKHIQSNQNMVLFIVYNLLENIFPSNPSFLQKKKNNEIAWNCNFVFNTVTKGQTNLWPTVSTLRNIENENIRLELKDVKYQMLSWLFTKTITSWWQMLV